MEKRKKTVSVRDIQHNLSSYLDLAKNTPVIITKYGKETAVLVNPEKYEIKRKETYKAIRVKDIMNDEFIGIHKDRGDWKVKSSAEIANDLREKAWYGK